MTRGDQVTRPDPGSRTILVVEDEAAVRDTLSEALRLFGYQVASVDSAESALLEMERSVPDLVLTDVHMRAISGVELCRRLKNDPRFALVPVVILTGVADLAARVAGLDAGADDFFAKPVEFTELQELWELAYGAELLVEGGGVVRSGPALDELRDDDDENYIAFHWPLLAVLDYSAFEDVRDLLSGVDRGLEARIDVLPAHHDHGVDPAVGE